MTKTKFSRIYSGLKNVDYRRQKAHTHADVVRGAKFRVFRRLWRVKLAGGREQLRLFRENGHRVFRERSKARRDNFIYTWAGPERGTEPGVASTGVIGPAALGSGWHMRTMGHIAAFDIEMLFLQYVVSCIIENRNAFSDSLFIYSVVFHYRTPDGSQKTTMSIILNGHREIMRRNRGTEYVAVSKSRIKPGFHIFGLRENATMKRIRKNYKETCKCEKRFSLYEVLTEFIGGNRCEVRSLRIGDDTLQTQIDSTHTNTKILISLSKPISK